MPFQPSISITQVPERKIDQAFYVAVHNTHFGHFLTETLGGCWHVLQDVLDSDHISDRPSMVIVKHLKGSRNDPLIRMLRDSCTVVFDDELPNLTYVECLLAASPTIVNRNAISPQHFAEVRRYFEYRLGTPFMEHLQSIPSENKVYISRSRLPAFCRHLKDEDELEKHLCYHGWKIFHPQEHSLEDQLLAYAGAQVISGSIGSAFHMLMAFGLESRNLSCKKLLPLSTKTIISTYVLQFAAQRLRCAFLQILHPDEYPPECLPSQINLKSVKPWPIVAEELERSASCRGV
jgi:capsular polysaccharide biosynthesis protein